MVVVCGQKGKLAKLQSAIREKLETDLADKVRFLAPDGFLGFLETLVAGQASAMKTVRGYRVSTNYVSGDTADGRAKSAAVAKLITKNMGV